MASWGSQFASGDQSHDARSEFAQSSYSICPKCKGKNFRNVKTVAGCRHNGDGYGTEEFICRGCGWATSFQYDESGDSYFYEMKYKAPAPPKEHHHLPITDAIKPHYRLMKKLGMSREHVQEDLIRKDFRLDDISAFLEELFSEA